MSRRPFSDVVRDGVGRVMSGATVTINVYDTGLPAVIYAADSGGAALASGNVSTGSNGRFTCWIDDNDYPMISLFTAIATKAGHSTDTRYFPI
jgi:hypothetical protein